MGRSAERTAAALLATSFLTLTACTSYMTVAVPARTGPAPGPLGIFRAGVAKVDITPIPGIPLGGYSIDGKASRGFWTRLHARALYLEDANHTPLVLVSADLSAIPGGLGDEVARLLHEEHGLTWISREHVLAAATHTHHGPGNYYTSRMFNQTPSPRLGFDEALFHFLAERIAFAVKTARDNAKEAELLVTDATELEASGAWKLENFFRNRSLPAFLLNPRASSLLDPDLPETCPPGPGQIGGTACRAVRPQVELLAVRHTGSDGFIGVAAFVPVHPTVLPSRLEVYSSDLFGVADVRLETLSDCDALGAEPVVAFFNGAEGDVSPTWTARNRKEVNALGKELAAKVCGLLGSVKAVDTTLQIRHARVELADQTFMDPLHFRTEDGGEATEIEHRTTKQGRAGAASVGGAEDGRSSLYELLGHREGKTMVSRREHGPKSQVGQVEGLGIDANVLAITLALNPPPRHAPISVYEIGKTTPNVVIVAVPGEFTTQMGRRVRESVWNALASPKPAKAEHILLAGLANEYLGYFTTPEEYDAQHYEGAMTLYGAASGPFLAKRLADLAALPDPQPEAATPWSYCYEPGSKEEFQPKDVWGATHDKDDGLVDLIQDEAAEPRVRRDLPVFCWRDAVPRLESVFAPSCQRSNPEVYVERKSGASASWEVADDNFGLDVVTAVTAVGRNDAGDYRTEWCAVWLGATEFLESTQTQDFRFAVKPLAGDDLVSASFGLVEDGGGWATDRFLQQPAKPLDPTFPTPLSQDPMPGQCTVPGPS